MEEKMLKIAAVGTFWITDHFILGAFEHTDVEINTIISRGEETGAAFVDKYDMITHHYKTVEEALEADKNGEVEIDAFYIASPNSIHYSQAKAALLAKKHVLLEKPFTTTVAELEELYDIARKQNVVLMEAIKTIRFPIFKKLKEHIANCLKDMENATICFGVKSPKYAMHLRGEHTNAFLAEMTGGALADMSAYHIWVALELFGIPKNYWTTAELMDSGVDICGKTLFEYDNFNIELIYNRREHLGSYALFNHTGGTIMIPTFHNMNCYIDEECRRIDTNDKEYPMYYELDMFYNIIQKDDYSKDLEELYQGSLAVMKIMEGCRKQAGIKCAEDCK